MEAAHADIDGVRRRIGADPLRSTWTGTAAERFHDGLAQIPYELGAAASAFEHASVGLARFARQLAPLQQKARHYARRIEGFEADLQAAQQRSDEAEADIEAARSARSAATEPLSLKAADDALEAGAGRLRLAAEDVERHGEEIARLRRYAHENREEYEREVGVCCAALDCAYATGAETARISAHLSTPAALDPAPIALLDSLTRVAGQMAALAVKAVSSGSQG